MTHIEQMKIKVLPDGRVSRRDAAVFLDRDPDTLAAWARVGRGPRPVKSGGRCFYWFEDLRAFAAGGSQAA